MENNTQPKPMFFEMYTNAGDNACRSLVNKINRRIGSKVRLTKEDIINEIEAGIKKIQVKFPEVHDTEPRYHIARYIRKKCEEVGYNYEISSYDI